MHDIKFIKDNSSLFDEILKKEIFLLYSKEIIILHQDYLDNLKKTQVYKKKKFLSKCFLEINQKELEKIKMMLLKSKMN